MNIKKITIIKYKNLQNCVVDFSTSGGLVVVAGINGSGKSNYLEAVSLIGIDLKGLDLPPGFNWPEYEIEYGENGVAYMARRSRLDETQQIYIVENGVPRQVEHSHADSLHLIAMYSGEFNRLAACGYVGTYGYGNSSELHFVSPDNLIPYVLALKWAIDKELGKTLFHNLEIVSFTYAFRSAFSVDPEEGPANEVEAILLRLLECPQGENGFRAIELQELYSVFEDVGIASSRVFFDVLSQIFGSTTYEGGILIHADLLLKTTTGQEISINDLSEGEKRLLLLSSIYNVLATNNTIVLLDEPDAHIHETLKLELRDYLCGNSGSGVTTICTSHSPCFVNTIGDKSLAGLRAISDGVTEMISQNEFAILRSLTDDRMSLFSLRPMLFFEGKSDVILFKKAIIAFRNSSPEYGDLTIDTDFDYFIVGGAGDSKYVYTEFRKLFPRRFIYMIFDEDDDGRKAHKSVVTPDLEDQNFHPLADIVSGGGFSSCRTSKGGACRLPKPDGVSCENYTIEDYVDGNYVASKVRELVNGVDRFHTVVNIRKKLKEYLGSARSNHPANCLMGFKPLIDLVKNLPQS